MMRRLFHGAMAWCLLTTLLGALAWWHAGSSFRSHLSVALQQRLPERLQLALQNRLAHGGPQSWVVEQLERDLSSLAASGKLPLLKSCRARVVQLLNEGTSPAAGWGEVSVHWQFGDGDIHEQTRLSVDCGINLPLLVGSQGLLALLLMAGMVLLPRPLSGRARVQVQSLMDSGVGYHMARRMQLRIAQFNPLQHQLFNFFCQTAPLPVEVLVHRLSQADFAVLTSDQLAWFYRALAPGNIPDQVQPWENAINAALAAATGSDRLAFDCREYRISIHGISIALSKTPFFYYLWYAQLRVHGEGWLLNPPVNRPDREAAESLIALMQAHGGHAKSINDLRDNGLRAKTLDQNRNKIRDELVSALGEDLAKPYLFESERDLKSGRYRYRLAVDASNLDLSTD